MASGLLTGAMTRERAAALPADDFRSRNPEFKEPRLSNNIELVSGFARLARATGVAPEKSLLLGPAESGHHRCNRGRAKRQTSRRRDARGELKLSNEEIAEIEGAAAASHRALKKTEENTDGSWLKGKLAVVSGSTAGIGWRLPPRWLAKAHAS